LKTDALRYLADALSEDIAATLALAFEELLANAKALARERGTDPGISRADTLGADAGTPLETLLRRVPENFSDSQASVTKFDPLVGRNAGNAARAAASGPGQAADNWGSWSRQAIPRLLPRLQTWKALSAFATLLVVAVLAPAVYERFAENPGGFSPSPGSPLVQREELPAPDSSPLPAQTETAPPQRPANVEAGPQLPRVSSWNKTNSCTRTGRIG
jgi:hypothetical protein